MFKFSWIRVSVPLILLLAQLAQVRPDDGGVVFRRVFQTNETVRHNKAQEMRRQINLRSDPCTDFYEYACGHWETEATPQSKLEHRIDMELLQLLGEAAHRNDSALTRQTKEFYKSCISAQAQQGQQQQQFLSEFIEQNGGFPAVPGSNWRIYHQGYDWLQVIARLRKYYGMDILIGLRVGYNYDNVEENGIYLSEPSTLLPPELCRRGASDTAAYAALEQLVATQLKTWLALGNEESDRLAGDILRFDQELCSSMKNLDHWTPWDAEQQIYTGNLTRKTLAEFRELYDLDFNAYMTTSFSQTIFKPVYMVAPDYYRQLKRTLDAHNSSQVANYIMYRAVAAISFPLDDKPQHRPAYCLANLKRLLPAALGEMYARQYSSDESKQQLLQLYSQLQEAMKQSVSAEWLEEGTRRIAQSKLSKLKLMLPIYEKPLKPLNLNLQHNNYWINLRQLLGEVQLRQLNRFFEEGTPQPADPVEAFENRVIYRPVQSRMELGWAMLQPPEQDERYGQAIRYATLGTTLAQQLATAFDEVHWSLALLERDNWDRLTAWRYYNRSDCFSRQVEEYLRANASATQLLIGNSAGLNIAFRAYLTWLGFQEPNNDFTRLRQETLPGINYTNTALFFLAYAQQNCRPKEQPTDLWSIFTYSVRQTHSWHRLQVNGPLQNLAEFAREFRCPAGTPMNPADKCVTY